MAGELQKTQESSPALTGEPRKVNQQDKMMAIGKYIHTTWDILYVESTEAYYYKKMDAEIYLPLNDRLLSEWIGDFLIENLGGYVPKDLSDGVAMVKSLTRNKIAKPSRDCIMVSDNVFWNAEEGKLYDHPTSPVFYRLFDTRYETKHIVKVDPFTPEQEQKLMNRYREELEQLNQGIFKERYNFLKVWANGSHDVYMDLQRAYAAMFLKKKPLGSYIFIGETRNGKSAAVGSFHTICGEANTSKVQLTQLGDPHYTHSLRSSILNAPDEEEDKSITSPAFFKIMSDHGVLDLPVMRSNQSVELECDFMSIFPMNHTPDWKGTGSAACLRRSLIIPFNNDLSQYDKVKKNFAKETFTAENMCDFMGTVFAYASYYTHHDFEFSPTMITEQGILEQDINNCLEYRREFERYFDGFQNFATLYNDYQYWCQARDTKYNTRKELKFVFRQYISNVSVVRHNGKSARCYRLPKSQFHHQLWSDLVLPEVEPFSVLQEKHVSIVEQLDSFYVGRGVDDGAKEETHPQQEFTL